jgi:alkylated DNA repair dioxygenase AlkB
MNFHSDDELGVQNTIAAISLGAPAKMSFRPRKRGAGNPKVCLELTLRHVRTFIAVLCFTDGVSG